MATINDEVHQQSRSSFQYLLRHSDSSAINETDEPDCDEDAADANAARAVEERLLRFLETSVCHDDEIATVEANAKLLSQLEQLKIQLPIHQEHAYPCSDTFNILPSPPNKWPQRPVMVRPTPGTSTRIRGIRYASDTDYRHFSGFCAGCILPVNTGTEPDGKSLVVDFESNHFVGTLLLRIRGIPCAETRQSLQENSYFENRKRRFQGIVKGKFKTPLKMSECVTGQVFSRCAGKLPAQWIVSTFIKFVSTLAPQLEATIDGDNPRFLSPLVATSQTALARPWSSKPILNVCPEHLKDGIGSDNNGRYLVAKSVQSLMNYSIFPGANADIERDMDEPHPSDAGSLMQDVHRELGVGLPSEDKTLSVSQRMKLRKKAYNAVAADKSSQPCFSLEHEYTFEFYQHLLVFHEDELVVDMGRPIGKVSVAPITNGQPVKFMAAHQDRGSGVLDSLWSFEIWHESLYPYALAASQKNRSN